MRPLAWASRRALSAASPAWALRVVTVAPALWTTCSWRSIWPPSAPTDEYGAAYRVRDMAADGIAVLDALGVRRAHVMGLSMGGMIVQTMAIEHPTRIASVTSVMSTTGDPSVGQAAPEVLGVLLSPPATTREAYIEESPKWMAWQSKKYQDAERTKQLAAIGWDRSNYGEGGPRQMAAIVSSGDRTERLRQLDVPALVIHGRDDTLITPSGGFATADAIPGAHLLFLSDMGHDMPEPLWPVIVGAVATLTQSSK